MTTQKLPQQIETIPDHRAAIAPYNFVPLPEKVVRVDLPLPTHDTYHEGCHTGRIECTLITASPLYVRCGYTPEEYAELAEKPFTELTEEQQRKRAQFFHLGDPEVPTIPGSSLRGMLRALVEIVGYGKVARVTDEKLFFRSLNDREIYTNHFVETIRGVRVPPDPQANGYSPKVRAGFLRRKHGGYVIEECGYGRVDLGRHNHHNYYVGDTGPGRVPDWQYQNRRVYVDVEPEPTPHFFREQWNDQHTHRRHPNLYLHFRAVRRMKYSPEEGLRPGVFVITGDMQHKHLEFVFLPEEIIAEHAVPSDMVRRFEDDDQITQWQEKAFPKDLPSKNSRPRDGWLRECEPVFFLLEADQKTIRFFGRAQLFRLPYDLSPRDFVPEDLRRETDTDLAEAIFGYVRQGNYPEDQSRAGRIFVSDAHCEAAPDGLWLDEPFHPKVLASPKPTTYQHYLVQEHDDQGSLKHYASSPDETAIRGHKLYWHKGAVAKEALRADRDQVQQHPTQYTMFKPVKPNVSFSFTIHFENLRDVELGALLWVLRLTHPQHQHGHEYRLKLGMGKPLGMGAVQITHTVVQSDRVARYRTLFDGKGWAVGETSMPPHVEARCVAEFEKFVLDGSGEQAKGYQELKQTLRIQCLLALLRWPGLSYDATRYMEIERPADQQPLEPPRPGKNKANEYARRRVLPTPLQIAGIDHTSPQASRTTNPNQPITQAAPPIVGDTFRGQVLEIEAGTIFVAVPGFSPKHVLGVMELGARAVRYRPGNPARVEVLNVRQHKERTILDLKPAARQPE